MTLTYKIEGIFLARYIITGDSRTLVGFEIRIALFHRSEYKYNVQIRASGVGQGQRVVIFHFSGLFIRGSR